VGLVKWALRLRPVGSDLKGRAAPQLPRVSPFNLGQWMMTAMPGPRPQTLTDQQRKKLGAAENRIMEASRAWAAVIREVGISGAAREFRVTPQALHGRISEIERAQRTQAG
jgi:hypothetical protein